MEGNGAGIENDDSGADRSPRRHVEIHTSLEEKVSRLGERMARIEEYGMSARSSTMKVIGLLSMFVLILSACGAEPGSTASPTDANQSTSPTGSASDTEPSDTGAGEEPSEDLGALTVGFGTSPLDLTAQHFAYAIENGFYADRGLEVELVPFAGDQTSLRALAVGEVDVLWTGCAAAMVVMEVGAPFVAISSTTPLLDYELVTTTEISTASEIAGHSLGVSQPGAVSYQVPQLMIEEDGGNFEDVEVVSVGGSAARVQALIAGTIDAAVLNSSFAQRTRAYDNLHTIAIAVESLPNFFYACEVATRATLEERPDALQALIEGTIEGAAWGEENPDAAAEISQSILSEVPPEEVLAGVQNFAEIGYHNLDATVPEDAWNFTVEQLVAGGELAAPLPYDEYVVTELSEAAASEVGG